MHLAGIRVRDKDVLALARLLYDAGYEDTAEALVVALEAEQPIVALTIQDREAILRSLDDPPKGLAELRGVLLIEREWRFEMDWPEARAGNQRAPEREVRLELWLGIAILFLGIILLAWGLR